MEETITRDLILFIENIDGVIAMQNNQADRNQQVAVDLGHKEEKVGRNDQCPCDSGKKWKKCGELNTEEHQSLLAKRGPVAN